MSSPERKRISVIITETNGFVDVITAGGAGNVPRGSSILCRIEFTAVKGLPYAALTGGQLRDYEDVQVDNHGLHHLPIGEYDTIRSTVLRICRGLSVTNSIIIEEPHRPTVELTEKNNSDYITSQHPRSVAPSPPRVPAPPLNGPTDDPLS